MVVYYPKNGKSIQINGFPIKRQGYPAQFPVEVYEIAVKNGLLVKTPQEMASLSNEEMKTEIKNAEERKTPIYVPKEQEYLLNNDDTNEYDGMLDAKIKELTGKSVSSILSNENVSKKEEVVVEAERNEYDDLLDKELAKLKAKEVVTEQNIVSNKIQVKSPNGVVVEADPLTYEIALSYVKTNEDGSLKVGKDGLYVLKAGWKPYSKTEICSIIDSNK